MVLYILGNLECKYIGKFINEKYYVKYLSLISICKFMSDN